MAPEEKFELISSGCEFRRLEIFQVVRLRSEKLSPERKKFDNKWNDNFRIYFLILFETIWLSFLKSH